jgi:hypothetical protein
VRARTQVGRLKDWAPPPVVLRLKRGRAAWQAMPQPLRTPTNPGERDRRPYQALCHFSKRTMDPHARRSTQVEQGPRGLWREAGRGQVGSHEKNTGPAGSIQSCRPAALATYCSISPKAVIARGSGNVGFVEHLRSSRRPKPAHRISPKPPLSAERKTLNAAAGAAQTDRSPRPAFRR